MMPWHLQNLRQPLQQAFCATPPKAFCAMLNNEGTSLVKKNNAPKNFIQLHYCPVCPRAPTFSTSFEMVHLSITNKSKHQ
jgi:hypothetical protein